MKNCTSAIIVLYNPNLTVLQKLYCSVESQCQNLIFVDNSPNMDIRESNANWVDGLKKSHCYYLSMNGNLGIAAAQNKGIEFAKNLMADFVLLLDQDSVLPENMVDTLLSAYQSLSQEYRVACIAPAFLDRKNNQILPMTQYRGILRKSVLPTMHSDNLEVAHVISSGMLIPMNIFDKIGLKKDNLFIDYVDTEWCLRVMYLGYKIFVCPKVVMEHDIGDGVVQVGNRSIMLHSDFRNYFAIRNAVYLILYHKLPLPFKIWEILKLPICLIIYTYVSRKRFYSLKMMLIAIKDGIFKKMGKGYFENKGL